MSTGAKVVYVALVSYLLVVGFLYPFVGGMAFFYAFGLFAMMALQNFLIWIWTQGAKGTNHKTGSDG